MSQNRIASLEAEIARRERIQSLESEIAKRESSGQPKYEMAPPDKTDTAMDRFKSVGNQVSNILKSSPLTDVAKNVGAAGASGVRDIGTNMADAVMYAMSREPNKYPGAEEARHMPGVDTDFYKLLGVEKKPAYTPLGALQTAIEFAPGAEIGGAVTKMADLGHYVPKAVEALKYGGKQIAPTINRAVHGALMEMLSGEKPTAGSTATSAAVTALLPPVLDSVVKAASKSKAVMSSLPEIINNYILGKTEQSAAAGSAHTPQQAAENVAQNYTNAEGKRMPVDFGAATNSPTAIDTYNKTSMIPGSGGSQTANIMHNQKADLAIKQSEEALASANKYADEVRGMTDKQLEEHHANSDKLTSEYNDVRKNHEAVSQEVNKAPEVVNNLTMTIPKDKSLPEHVSGEARKVFKGLRKESGDIFTNLDNSNIRLKPGEGQFVSYETQAKDVLNQAQSLHNLFGPNSDMPASILKEVQQAATLIGNKGGEIPLKVIRQHASELGKLYEKAKLAGADNAARMLMNMRTALVDDTKYALQMSGQSEAVEAWNKANQLWAKSAEFYKPRELRNIVGRQTTDKDYVAKPKQIAQELHDPNNASIMQMLSPETQKAAGKLLITGDKIKALTPDQIAGNFGNLTQDQLKAFAAHSPEEAKYLQSLPKNIETATALGKNKDAMAKILDRTKLPKGKELETATAKADKAAEKLAEAKNDRLNPNPVKSSEGTMIAKALTQGVGYGTLGGAGFMAKQIRKLLLNPELLDKYIAGEKFPVKKAAELPSLTKAIDKYITRNR